MESLCQNCRTFYGHINGLCSSCYQKSKLNTNATQAVSDLLSQLTLQSSTAGNSPTLVEEVKFSKTNCHHCNRKLGPINFPCKCGGLFCARHRLPESHSCSIDYKVEGKRKLTEENPQVVSDKFTRIQRFSDKWVRI